MKRNSLKKIVSVASAAVVCAGAVFAFAGCTTKHPQVTITYTFNNVDYAVTYTLSRYDAPKTVQHFIEVADTGFYNGLCVHDYDDNNLYAGGYTIENGTLAEKDYFTAMKKAEADGKKITQSVWAKGSDLVSSSPVYTTEDDTMTPLYTVYGEFENNGTGTKNARENVHSFGALVMYYTNKENDDTTVVTERNDGGKNNNGNKYDNKSYWYNSATSLFYTFTGQSDSARDRDYCVFGKVDDAGREKLQELVDAIGSYKNDLSEDASFTEDVHLNVNEYHQNDPVDAVRRAGSEADYKTPIDKPIIVKSVKVNKY